MFAAAREQSNLASFTPYPTEQGIWFLLHGEDCTQLALDEVSPDQVLPEDVAIVGIPISTPTLGEWEDGDRVVTCAIGVESAADAEADPRAADVVGVSVADGQTRRFRRLVQSVRRGTARRGARVVRGRN